MPLKEHLPTIQRDRNNRTRRTVSRREEIDKKNEERWRPTEVAGCSIFVDGIPWQMSVQGFWRLCRFEPGVVEVFISRKRRNYKTWTFGFIRVATQQAKARVKSRLSRTSILGRRLVVEDARQNMRKKRGSSSNMVWRPKEQVVKSKMVWRKKQRWVWRKKQQQPENDKVQIETVEEQEMKNRETQREETKHEDEQRLKYEARIDVEGRNFIEGTVSEENMEWLKRSVVGITVTPTDPEIIWGRLLDWQAVMRVTPIGLYKFLVTCDCEETMEEAMRSEIFSNVFEYAARWNEEEAGETRRVWIECYGLPLHGWTEQNMQRIGRFVGHVLKVEDRALQRQDLGSFKVLVDTTYLKQVNHEVTLGLGGHLYSIQIREYSGGIHWISGEGNRGTGKQVGRQEDNSSAESINSPDPKSGVPGMEEECDGSVGMKNVVAGMGSSEETKRQENNSGQLQPQSNNCTESSSNEGMEASLRISRIMIDEGAEFLGESGKSGGCVDDIEEPDVWGTTILQTPSQRRLQGFSAEDMDLEAGTNLGPPPGFEAQEARRTWSGHKLLKAAWSIWASVKNYSAPGRLEHNIEQKRTVGLDLVSEAQWDSTVVKITKEATSEKKSGEIDLEGSQNNVTAEEKGKILQTHDHTETNEEEEIAKEEDVSEALKSLSVGYALGLLPVDADEYVDNFVEKRTVARKNKKEATNSRIICTRSVTAKARSSQ